MAPTARLPPKKDVALALLEQASMYIHLDPRADTVQVPAGFKKQPQLVLQVGLNMAVNIPDLHVDENGLSCTLSFNRTPFFCMIPWPAVFALVGENGQAMVWAEDVPAEVSAQAQAQKAPPPKPRAHLRSVGEGESAPPAAAEATPEAAPPAAATATAREKKAATKKSDSHVEAGAAIRPTKVSRKTAVKAPAKTTKPTAAGKVQAKPSPAAAGKKPSAEPKAAHKKPEPVAEPAAARQPLPAKKPAQPKAEPARAATEISKPKRELPPYLRVVK